MDKILVKPLCGDDNKVFLEVVRKVIGLSCDEMDVLYKKFGKDLYLLLSIFSGKSIRFIDINRLSDIRLGVIVYNIIVERVEGGEGIESVMEWIIDNIDEFNGHSLNSVYSKYRLVSRILGSNGF